DLHVNFKLSKTGEAIGLFAADGTAIDAIIFGQQESDVSQGRFPDGGILVFRMPNPTPGLPNKLPNIPPTLTTLSNGQITFSWQSDSGLTYQVEYVDDLRDISWTSVGPPISGTGGTLTNTNN